MRGLINCCVYCCDELMPEDIRRIAVVFVMCMSVVVSSRRECWQPMTAALVTDTSHLIDILPVTAVHASFHYCITYANSSCLCVLISSFIYGCRLIS